MSALRASIHCALAFITVAFGACDSDSADLAHNDAAFHDAGEADASVADDSQIPLGLDAAGDIDASAALCNVQAPSSCSLPAPRYAEVAQIITNRCVTCHDGRPMGPWPLTDYQHVADWAAAVRDELLRCAMPPPEAPAITEGERDLLLLWVRCGARS